MEKVTFFNRHLYENGESYFEHLIFALSMFLWLMLAGITLLCHAIFPFFFAVKASEHIKKINQIMQKRVEMLFERRKKRVSEELQSPKETKNIF